MALVALFAASAANAHESIEEQIARVDEEIRMAPDDAGLYLQRAELFRIHGEVDESMADYRRAARLDPGLGAFELGLGRLFLAAGRADEALGHLQRFLVGRPDDMRGLACRGRALQALGRFEAAVRDYSAAIARSAGTGRVDPDLYVERAQALRAIGAERLDEALTGLDEGMSRLGSIPALELLAIELEIGGGRSAEALRRVRVAAARSLRPERWLVLEGEILEKAGRAAEARNAFSAARTAIDDLPPSRRLTPLVDDLNERLTAALERLGGVARVEAAR